MFVHTKDLLEKLGNHSEQYMTVVIQDVDSKRYTIYYIKEVVCAGNFIILDLMYQKKFYSTKEVFDIISHLDKENSESTVKINLPEGKFIDDFEFWDVISPVENSLILIIGVKS